MHLKEEALDRGLRVVEVDETLLLHRERLLANATEHSFAHWCSRENRERWPFRVLLPLVALFFSSLDRL